MARELISGEQYCIHHAIYAGGKPFGLYCNRLPWLWVLLLYRPLVYLNWLTMRLSRFLNWEPRLYFLHLRLSHHLYIWKSQKEIDCGCQPN